LLWITYEPYINKYINNISKEKTLVVCYNFIKLRRLYGIKYTIYTQMDYYYNQACKMVKT